jgi:drug/metabolite transporter (DMT)-like permease
MTPADGVRLTLLAAIWGASFIFMRVAAPVLGPVLTAELRALLAGLALAAYFAAVRFDPQWRRHWRAYAVTGLVNSALPFFLYSWAALHIPASLSVILNSSSPLFGALLGALWLGEPLTPRKLAGLALGSAGVALVSGVDALHAGPQFALAVAACLGASLCYALAGVYIKRVAAQVPPKGYAVGSQLAAALFLLPLLPVFPPASMPGPLVLGNVLALALLCSAVAYLLYYRLIADVGPTRALTVTFLMPAFGMLWGALFLGEAITAAMLGGGGLILAGTLLVVRKA